jgi:hypothetical protein
MNSRYWKHQNAMGFRLKSLRLLSPIEPAAEATFGPGLNVVTGASNTGKSFMVELIKFALGKQSMDKRIPEAESYDRVRLTIETHDGRTFSIVRGLMGGDAHVWKGDSDVPPEATSAVSARGSSKGSLPGLLLELTGLENKRIKNKQAETRPLTFRDLRKLVVMDEERIISSKSPAQTGEAMDRTGDAAAFTLVLTGVDDSAMVVAEQEEDRREERRREAEKISFMIGELRADVPDGASLRSAQAQLRRLDASIESARGSYDQGFASVSQLEGRRAKLIKQQTDVMVRAKSLGQLVERFRVLDSKYASDLERLSAMGEAAEHFSTLEHQNCPVCGSPFSVKTDHHDAAMENPDALYAGLQAERQKILALQLDLRSTIETLSADVESYSAQGNDIAEEIREAEAKLDRKFKPAARELSQRIGEFEEKRSDTRRLVGDMERIERYKSQRLKIDAELKAAPVSKVDRNDTTAKHKFSLEVEKVLAAWKFPETGRVQFDRKTEDITINGKHRGDLGKGYRAVTASAFLVGLLEYCKAKNLPHPGFVVLDTPLRTFKDKEQGGEQETVSDDVKDAFFRDLASRGGDRQFVVLENDDAPEDVRGQITYLHFSGNPDRPPMGFVPPRRL